MIREGVVQKHYQSEKHLKLFMMNFNRRNLSQYFNMLIKRIPPLILVFSKAVSYPSQRIYEFIRIKIV